MGPPAVEVIDLVKRYGDKTAVDGLSLAVQAASITAILGPNGAGKTTTIEMCEGYRRPDRGTVRVFGADPIADRRRLAARVGVMLQAGGAWSGIHAVELLRYVASLYAHPLDVGVLVETLGLDSCGRTPHRRLSGGQQRRLALATALVGRPELVFLDEPTSGLDPQARRATWELLGQLAEAGVTVVLSTHQMEEAERLATFVHVIDRGRLVTSGTPEQLTATGSGKTIRFDAPADLDTASLGVELGPACVITRLPHGGYEVAGDITPDALAAVTAWCATRGVMPEHLSVDRHTLEDVFLELTGRELRA